MCSPFEHTLEHVSTGVEQLPHDTKIYSRLVSTGSHILRYAGLLKNERVETDLHVKPTSKHQYLHTKSCHPKHCKTAIPLGQKCFCKA